MSCRFVTLLANLAAIHFTWYLALTKVIDEDDAGLVFSISRKILGSATF